ncbi:MAG TPA: recombinase RecA [Coprothermobacter proteolyticus]|uniref:Protein RecA n=1 Tax=Coprothermobacter proteolyticus (strain ATCC 35245 / DSM 5265 / OCM 4 / BT) TaxID=309798 RepID=B5Y8R3_COPPD|nr:recombinase RecA [Coprothermobacter proteolyticus]MBK6585594.1 recombinase RecA [Coprothermobacter sp.]ACI17997.1 recombinase RecA [Coprothermobacter proteolyticus DSM 5265]MBP8983759.1 recombinase RecA [Coprothermobacter sp.]HOA64851.1 recombinase RecA [Coprothermobacter proteolyticus]HOK24501.1 recombinase RecA [Coprothermobacter proteolyticus]
METTDRQNQDDKQKALDMTVQYVEKRFGKGSLMRLGETGSRMQVETISTGALTLDLALGIGGIPRGRIVEIYGPEGSGKTTLALHIIANAQKNGGTAVFIDAEHALDPVYARKLGVDVENLYISQPDYGEQALEIAEELSKSGAVDVIVIDSVAALVPKAELDGEIGDSFMGLQARLMSQALRKLTGIASKTGTAIVFLNQLREKVGITFGNPEVTPGGRALKFFASARIELRKSENIGGSGDASEGAVIKAKIVKNKLAPPFRTATFDLYFGKGISWTASVVDAALIAGVIQKSGSWYSYNDIRLGQGKENAVSFLEEHPETLAEIESAVRGTLQELPVEIEE